MKTSMKTIAVSILAAAALVASSTAAQAGEGGAAGSVSLQFNSFTGALPGNAGEVTANQARIRVTRESSSIAVGKNGALSSATSGVGGIITAPGNQNGNLSGETITSAIGTGGVITATNVVSAAAGISTTNETTNDLLTGQGNSLTSPTVDPVTGAITNGATISKTTLTLP